ncbi:MAG: VWA domain-containing protein, partial [Lachnospiraceae bacterium]|nr:VWA domain-containing protein [Lachnospiraceae bacterium]
MGFLGMGTKQIIDSQPLAKHISQEKLIAFANALYTTGSYEEALEALDDYVIDYGYDDACRLLTARIYLAEGDFVRADGIYRVLDIQTDEIAKEAEFALWKSKSSSADLTLMDYLADCGENIEEYGFEQTDYQKIRTSMQMDAEDMKPDICSHIKEEYDLEEGSLLDCALAVASVNAIDANDIENEEPSFGRFRRVFENAKREVPELFLLECVKKAVLKANVLSGEFDRIAGDLNDASGYHEQMVAAELYMGGQVRQSDFSNDYREIDPQEASAVKNQINKIYQKNRDRVSVQENKKLKARVDAAEMQLNDPALAVLKENLTIAAGEAGTDRTKVYLELAKIENYLGNENAADNCIGEAIYYSQECKDDDYVSAMTQIIGVVNDDADDLELIKNIPEYTAAVCGHALTIPVEAIVSSREEPADFDMPEVQKSNNEDFALAVADYVSRARSAISIGKIDTSAFPDITAKVQISNTYINDVDTLKKDLNIYDCGAGIENFSLKKIDYAESNIFLCCDVSGSMDGSIQNLRDAVITFITDKNPKENIAIVTFNDAVVDARTFGTSDEELISFAENMEANGGTDMVSAVVNCLGQFSVAPEANNVLILMTDGQDSDPKSSEAIDSEIGKLAEEKNAAIYTLGLGSEVDTAYLNMIACSGNGEFIYVSDGVSLSSFYDMLHGQILNQYEISYEAVDTLTITGRNLEAAMPAERIRDSKRYDLTDNADADSEMVLDVRQNMSISGMTPRCLY